MVCDKLHIMFSNKNLKIKIEKKIKLKNYLIIIKMFFFYLSFTNFLKTIIKFIKQRKTILKKTIKLNIYIKFSLIYIYKFKNLKKSKIT